MILRYLVRVAATLTSGNGPSAPIVLSIRTSEHNGCKSGDGGEGEAAYCARGGARLEHVNAHQHHFNK